VAEAPSALWQVAGGERLFFQNFQRNFFQDLREGYRQAFGNDFSEMFMIWECG
jgi:hypothetical protein